MWDFGWSFQEWEGGGGGFFPTVIYKKLINSFTQILRGFYTFKDSVYIKGRFSTNIKEKWQFVIGIYK